MDAQAHLSSAPTTEEAAAITAALVRFAQDTAAARGEPVGPAQSPWQRAARLEGVARGAAWE